MQVLEVEDMYAWCDGRNGRKRINTMLIGEVRSGDWLLTFLESAREAIDAERAALINSALGFFPWRMRPFAVRRT